MPPPPQKPSFFSWLGRQVGHVAKAVQQETPPKPAEPKVIFRNDKVEEQPHPDQPGVKLRRTTIDEVIIEGPKTLPDKRSEQNQI